jgi:CheY-like chemotaxis protein/HEAT repeat protein
MSRLHDFDSKDFVEQVSILGSLDPAHECDSIPEIISLLDKIPKHEAIVLVMGDTLKKLFSSSEEYTARYLASDNHDIRKICIEVSGRMKFASTAALLGSIARQASDEKENRTLFEVITALSQIKPEESVDLFRKNVDHEDPLISSLCIEILGTLNDAPTFERMHAMIIEAQADSHNGLCDLPTAGAIKALSTFQGKDVTSFLISILHHKNPGVRRVVHYELSRKGLEAVNALNKVFQEDNVDSKIFAANILGLIETKEATDVLVNALDTNRAAHPNIRFAIYEALGNTPGMSGLVCLADGLMETDRMVLLSVVSSLGMHLNQWILDKITEMIKKGTDHSKLLIQAIITSGTLNIFEGLYLADEALATMLIEEIKRSGDGEHLAQYKQILAGIGSARSQADMQILDGLRVEGESLHILAVDDSKAMLNFYKSVAASLSMSITTALNGREALDIISVGKGFNLIITDMNMPVMDGLEFTRKVRSDPAFSNIPIIMITTESERSQEDLARKAGVDHFMHKPFDAEKLKDKITACVIL